MIFEYAIRNSEGKYFSGEYKKDGSPKWVDNKSFLDKAYHYTLFGAGKKIADFPAFFKGCEVVRMS